MRFSTLQLLTLTGCLGLILALTVPAAFIYLQLTTPVEDNHNYSIGSEYGFESFEIYNSRGEIFPLHAGELKRLEKSWVFGAHQVTLTKINNLEYRAELSDGYEMKLHFWFGESNSRNYFDIWLLGSGGGFMADVYTITIPADSVFSDSREQEFVDWAKLDRNANSQKAG